MIDFLPGSPDFIKACVSYYHHIGFDFVEAADIIIGVGASEILSFCFYGCCEAGV